MMTETKNRGGKEMKNQIETVEFKTSKGAQVVVTAELILSKTHYADGDNVTVDCCEMSPVRATIDGFPEQVGYQELHSPVNHEAGQMLAKIGKLGLIAENMILVESAIDKLKKHPTWIAKQARIEKNRKEIEEMETRRDANGYCRKCGSYCYGDCEAN